MSAAPSLSPSRRLLCGPGPSNVPASVLEAMQKPMLGHLDDEFHAILTEVVEMLAVIYQRSDGLTFPLSASGTAGMEAGIVSLVEPGETVVVGVGGFFGDRIAEAARRRGARVVEVRAEPGAHVSTEALLDAVQRNRGTALLAVVHAETSTGVRQPIEEVVQALSGSDVMVMADCVTSLGGTELRAQAWGIDYCFSCSQKCLGAPPGISPISLSPHALERIASRPGTALLYFDIELLARYWIERPVTYHHTVPVLQIYALHEALRLVLEEGLENRWERHARVGAYLQRELSERGFALLAEESYRLPQLTAVVVPEGVDGRAVQRRLVEEHGLEVGGALGSSAPPIWRIGLMGENASFEAVDYVLQALEAVVGGRRESRSRGSTTAVSGREGS
jgi:alanine-glyoxylate transaminase/serine-glyoxylate transaminase/serine-pyruvate transaminase